MLNKNQGSMPPDDPEMAEVYKFIDAAIEAAAANGVMPESFEAWVMDGGIGIIDQYRLIVFLNKQNIFLGNTRLTLEGVRVRKMGGIKVFLDAVEQERRRKEEAEQALKQMELTALKRDVEQLHLTLAAHAIRIEEAENNALASKQSAARARRVAVWAIVAGTLFVLASVAILLMCKQVNFT